MKPVEKAARVYQQEPCGRTFSKDLEAQLLHGIVCNTPESFVMARYVMRGWDYDQVCDSYYNPTNYKNHDCLHVFLAAGDLKDFFTFPHKSVKWVSFERGNKLRYYPYDQLKELCTHSIIPPMSYQVTSSELTVS